MKYLKTIPLLFLSVFGYCQDWNYYKPLQAKGEIPRDFSDAYSTKVAREKQKISRDIDVQTQFLESDFYDRSEYFLDEYLISGKVFFGDTITNYCQSVLNKLLKNEPELKNQLRVYTVKTPIVNAAATANGIIFINLGLIAQLETEAQLAFILAHELVHYKNGHVLDQYIEEERILDNPSYFGYSSEDEKLTQLSNYSKSQEFEADEQGFEKYFTKTGYNTQAPFEVLDILQYAYLPVDEVVFEKSIFESGSYELPKSLFLKEVAKIKAVDDYDDENSSHPNLLKRRKKLNRISKKYIGQNYIISEPLFLHCRKIARYELSRLYLINREYVPAIYNSFLSLQTDRTNRYHRLTIAKALNGLTVYESKSDLSDVLESYEEIEGESQQVYHLIENLGEGELSVLNLNYCLRLKRDFPEDLIIEALYKSALKLLVFDNQFRLDDFHTLSKDSLVKNANHLKDSINRGYQEEGKLARIKSKKIDFETSNSETYWKYALAEFFNDEQFILDFEDMEDAFDSEAKSDYSEEEKTKIQFSTNRYKDNISLNISRAIAISPRYLNLNETKEEIIDFQKTEENKAIYKEHLRDCSKLLDLNLTFLDYKDSKEMDATDFNNHALLQSWFTERITHFNHDIAVSDGEYLADIIEAYGSPYFISTGNISMRKFEGDMANKIACCMILPITPFILADLLTADYNSFNYFFLFDLRDGNALITEYNSYETKDAHDYMKSMMYNYLLQVTH